MKINLMYLCLKDNINAYLLVFKNVVSLLLYGLWKVNNGPCCGPEGKVDPSKVRKKSTLPEAL